MHPLTRLQRHGQAELVTDPTFGLRIPTSCPDVPAGLLLPRNTWYDGEVYDHQAAALAQLFKKNFEQFTQISADVRAASPASE